MLFARREPLVVPVLGGLGRSQITETKGHLHRTWMSCSRCEHRNNTVVKGHPLSVAFSVSNLALYPAVQAVYGILLEQDFVSSRSSCVTIVSRMWYRTWRCHRLAPDLFFCVRCTASRYPGGAEDQRALLYPVQTMICPTCLFVPF